jgi:hypothetical protein
MKIDKYGKMLHRTMNAGHQTVLMREAHKKSFAGLQQRSRKALFPSSQENWTGGPPMPSSPVFALVPDRLAVSNMRDGAHFSAISLFARTTSNAKAS